MKKTGIELIADERREQLEKHGRTIEDDIKYNSQGQLSVAAGILGQKTIPDHVKETLIPKGWDGPIWNKMINKPYKERLIIAGALYVAELDRLIKLESEN